MELYKAIDTCVDASQFETYTDVFVECDGTVSYTDKIRINHMILTLDEEYFTDYSNVYIAHRYFTIKGKIFYVWVRLEWGDFNDICPITIKVYKEDKMEYRLRFADGICSNWQTNYNDIVESANWWNECTEHSCKIESREVVEG